MPLQPTAKSAAAERLCSTRKKEIKIPIYQIDTFTSEVFSGNPAAVCMLDAWIDDKGSGTLFQNLCEVARPLSNNLKGGYHINCPFRICRQRAGSCGNTRAELAPTRYRDGSQLVAGLTQSGVLAKTAGRSIKRMVQLRK